MSVLFQERNVVSDQLGSELLKIKTFAISNVSFTCDLIHIQVQLESRAPP